MKKLLLFTLCVINPALAQTPGPFVQLPSGSPASPVTAASLNASFSGKVDTVSGILTSPTINTGLAINGAGPIVFVPRGSPIAGSRASLLARYTMNNSVQEFADSRECDSSTTSPTAGGNVCHYTYIEGHPGSGQIWARNAVTILDAGFNTSLYSALGDEIDINNSAGDYGTFGSANGVGLLFNGLGHMNTAAISIQTGNTTGTLPIWYNGFYLGPNAVSSYGFHDTSNSQVSTYVQGSHVFAADYSDANTTSAAIRLGNGGATQGIVAHVRGGGSTADYGLVSSDAGGHVHIGTATLGNWYADGNLVPGIDNTYSAGTTTNRLADVEAVNVHTGAIVISGVLLAPFGAPASSTAACTPGQTQNDATYHYWCATPNHWLRVAGVTF